MQYYRTVPNIGTSVRALWLIEGRMYDDSPSSGSPGDSKKGPINAIKPVLKVPSHHGPDVMTVKPEIEINSLAVAVPTTIMHVHSIIADLPEGTVSQQNQSLLCGKNNQE